MDDSTRKQALREVTNLHREAITAAILEERERLDRLDARHFDLVEWCRWPEVDAPPVPYRDLRRG